MLRALLKTEATCLIVWSLGSPFAACETVATSPVFPLAGGGTTVFDRSSNAFSAPATNLDDEAWDLFRAGDAEFEARFVPAPAPVNGGLGPTYNQTACVGCHVRDGRGPALTRAGSLMSPLVVQLTCPEGVDCPRQLRDHAVFGSEPEARVEVTWVSQLGVYGDGEPFILRRPVVNATRADGTRLSGEVLVSPRIPSPVFGLGLLEAVPDSTLVSLADPEDLDGDGISGRVNLVSDLGGTLRIGRFGWKANVATLLEQAAIDYEASLGVSTSLTPEPDGSHELPDGRLFAVAHYTATLAVPARIDPSRLAPAERRSLARGEVLFEELGCASCHRPTLVSGPHPIAALAHQTFHPYTDLLLHNVGFDLADGRPDHLASPTEWRTAPLWGIGLTQTVLPTATFLHDGRARTLAEAILWHGGEAERSRESFRLAPASARKDLLAFLRSL